jgi:hypothetical protein
MSVGDAEQRERIEEMDRLERRKRVALVVGPLAALAYVVVAVLFASAYPKLLLGVPFQHNIWLLGGLVGGIVGGLVAGGRQWDRGVIVGTYVAGIAVVVLVGSFVGYHLLRLYLQRGLFFGYLIPFYGSMMGLIVFVLFFGEGALGGYLGNLLRRGIARLG